MGRLYDARIKKIGDELVEKYQDVLGIDFYENKKIVSGKLNTNSKFVRNKVTGYVTSKIRKIRSVSVEAAAESQTDAQDEDTGSKQDVSQADASVGN